MNFDDGLSVQEMSVNNGEMLISETSDQTEKLELEKGENKLDSKLNEFGSELNLSSPFGMRSNDENSEISILTEQLARERNENERLQENINGLQESLVKCKQELLEYQKRAYDSEILSTRHQHEYKVLEHEKNSLQESLMKQKDETSMMESRLKELNALKNNNLLEYTKKVSHLEVSCRDFEHKISILQKSRDELETEHSKICDELRRVKSELEFAKGHYEEKIKIKEESIKLKEEQIKQIQGLLDMSISTAQNLENEIEQYKKNQELSRVDSYKYNTNGESGFSGENPSDEGRQLTDVQAAELLIKIFGEQFLDSVSSLNEVENTNDSNNIGSRRILIDLLTQIEDYQQNLEQSRKEIYTLREELKECQHHLKVTVPDFELTRQKYEMLQAENNFAIEQLQSLTQERRILMHQISEYKTLWEHETNKREIYEEQCKMITSKLSMFALNAENRDDSLSREKINTENGGSSSPCNSNSLLSPTSATGVYDDIVEQNTQLKLQISRLIDGIEMESQIQVRKLNLEISSYREQFSKMKKERDELVSQYQELIKKLEDENNSLKSKNLANLEEGKENKERLTRESDDSSGNVVNTSTFIKQFGEVAEVCKSLSEKLTNEIEQSAQYRSELSRYKAQCEYMENLCERNRKRMDELFEERDQLFKQVNDLRKIEDSKELELNSYKEKVLNKESEIMDIRRENDHLKNNIGNLNNCISGLKNDIELTIKQRNQDNALQRDLISQLQGELEGKYVEINSMRKSQDLILQREFDESQRLRQQLKSEYNKYHDLEVKYKEVKLENENLNKKNTELEKKLSDNTSVLGKIENSVISNTEKNIINSKERISISIESENGQEDINSIKSSLEESKKLQNYWKDLVHSTEKQLESKINELNELKNKEGALRIELEEKIELINKIEQDNKNEQQRLNENIKTMTLKISSIDEEIIKRETDLRENLSKVCEENSILKKEIEESKQIEQDLRSQYQNIVRMHSVDIERLQNSNKQCMELKEEIKKIVNDSKKTEDENTNLIMEMQNDINQLRRQLELSIQKCESAKLDSENYKDLLIKLKNDQKLPQNYEKLLENELPSESVEKEDKVNTLVQSSNIGVNSSNSASLLLMRKVQTLTNNLEEMDSKLNESSIEIQRLSFEKNSLRDENKLLQKRLSEELERVTEFATKAENNENTLIRLGELVTLREANDRLRKELINATERYNNVEKKFESETRLIDPLKCEIRKLNAEIDELKSQCEEKSVLSKTWEEQYNRILVSYGNIDSDEINKLKSVNEELKNTLDIKNKEYEKLKLEKQSEHVSNEELQLTKQQMEQLRKVYMSTNQKLKEERNKNTKLENEIKKLNVSADISSNPNTNKLNNNDVKNVTQATNNLVNLVLKLTKFSLLKLELDKNKSLNARECIDDNNEDIIPLKKRPILISVDKHSVNNNTTPPSNQSNLH